MKGNMDVGMDLLVQSDARLYTLGVDLEMARAELRRLVEQGEPLTSDAVREACETCEALSAQWNALEAEHQALVREHEEKQARFQNLLEKMKEQDGPR